MFEKSCEEKIRRDSQELGVLFVELKEMESELKNQKEMILEEEKQEIQKVKDRYRDKISRSTKKISEKILAAKKRTKEIEEAKATAIGKLMLKKTKENLTEDEAKVLDLLLEEGVK